MFSSFRSCSISVLLSSFLAIYLHHQYFSDVLRVVPPDVLEPAQLFLVVLYLPDDVVLIEVENLCSVLQSRSLKVLPQQLLVGRVKVDCIFVRFLPDSCR